MRGLKRKLDAAYFGNITTNGPNGLGSLTTATVDGGDSWTNLDWVEEAKSEAEQVHTNTHRVRRQPRDRAGTGIVERADPVE